MLKRRNTIHPLQASVQWQPELQKSKLQSTNPFLSSSCDDMKKSTIYKTEEFIADHYTQVLEHKHTRTQSNTTTTSITNTNPFLFEDDTNPHFTQIQQDGNYNAQNDTPCRNEKYKTHSRPGGSRRMSLDLFKAPFGWHRRRRATCALADLDKMSTIAQSCDQVQEILRSNFTNINQSSEDTNYNDNTEDDTILKSSRYHPEEEDQLDDTHYSHAAEHQLSDHGYENSESQKESFNPFLNSDSKSDVPTFAGAHPADINNYMAGRLDQQQQMTFQDGGEKGSRNWRRRHSDFSVDDCPRLLALQRQQQQEQQQQQQQSERYEVVQQQDISASRMSLTKSTTDTALNSYSYSQNPRSSSYGQPSSTSTNSNPRRNSVVVGRNIVRPKLAVRSLYEPTTSRRYSEAEYQHYNHDLAHSYTEPENCSQDLDNTYQLSSETGQTSLGSNNVHPFDQPTSCQPRSIGRRESQSYAQDFMKNIEPWVPRPWTTTSISSCGSSPASPLYHCTFPHEREDYQESQDDLDQTVPTYHDMSEIQRKPYGQEEDEEEAKERNEIEHTNNPREYGYDFGDLDSNRTYQVDENEVRLFYNSIDWKMDEEIEGNYDQARKQNVGFQQSVQSSRSRLTRKATIAKNKIYKLLKQPQHQYQPESQIQLQPQFQSQTQQMQFRSDSDEVEVEGEMAEHYQQRDDISRSNTSAANSTYSATSSLRARMRLTPKTKTVLRQVKRRISIAAKSVFSEASRAANTVTPILRNRRGGTTSTTTTSANSQYVSADNCQPQQGFGNYCDGKIDEYAVMDHQEYYQHYHSGYNNEVEYPRRASVPPM
ncbi:hypothetical protein BGZ76_008703 [Entomortierella beljakovae]|nr:hypothetical protein BGZ76_008703 [Entomortierella beljakovae]